MLRQLCAVAQVPQTEDVGFDAVATILRTDGALLRAENSFCVQFKARSVREISYDREAYEWLRALELPLFIGSVDLSGQELALYSTHNLACRADSQAYTQVTMRLDPPSRAEKGVLEQWLGDPILRWTHEQGFDDAFKSKAYCVLSTWVRGELLHGPLRSIRTMPFLRWTTNEVPSEAGTAVLGGADDLRSDIDQAAPYLMKVAMHLLDAKDALPESIGFLLLAMWLEKQGVDQLRLLTKLLATNVMSHGNDLTMSLKIKREP